MSTAYLYDPYHFVPKDHHSASLFSVEGQDFYKQALRRHEESGDPTELQSLLMVLLECDKARLKRPSSRRGTPGLFHRLCYDGVFALIEHFAAMVSVEDFQKTFSVQYDGETPLMFLLKNSALLSPETQTLEEQTEATDRLRIAKLLIAKGVSMNVFDAGGRHALHRAVGSFQRPITEHLLKTGVNINLKSTGPQPTALSVQLFLMLQAFENRHYESSWTLERATLTQKKMETELDFLLQSGANPNVISGLGDQKNNPLFELLRSKSILFFKDTIALLTQKGLDLNYQDAKGKSALHVLMSLRHDSLESLSEQAHYLIDLGVDAFLKDDSHRTALEAPVFFKREPDASKTRELREHLSVYAEKAALIQASSQVALPSVEAKALRL